MNLLKNFLQHLGNFLSILTIVYIGEASITSDLAMPEQPIKHTRLQYRNKFKTPDEVVKYYVGRDASGFVWSGMLEIERKNFTNWKFVPEFDTFFISKSATIKKPEMKAKDKAIVKVKYDLVAMGDAHGTRMPAQEKEKWVTFALSKIDGKWRIDSPSEHEIQPIVDERKFNYTQ